MTEGWGGYGYGHEAHSGGSDHEESLEGLRTPLIFYDGRDQLRRMETMAAFLEQHADGGRFAIQDARLLAHDLRLAVGALRAASGMSASGQAPSGLAPDGLQSLSRGEE